MPGKTSPRSAKRILNEDIHELMDLSIGKNMIDKDEYPATAELESRCVHILADLWNSPDRRHHTRLLDHPALARLACLGGLALKHKWRSRMKAAGKPTDKPNLVTGPRAGLLAQIRRVISMSSCVRSRWSAAASA